MKIINKLKQLTATNVITATEIRNRQLYGKKNVTPEKVYAEYTKDLHLRIENTQTSLKTMIITEVPECIDADKIKQHLVTEGYKVTSISYKEHIPNITFLIVDWQ